MSDNSTPVVATKKISYGPKIEDQIEPQTIFVPADHGLDIEELRALEAVQDCNEAELAVAAAQTSGKAAAGKRGKKAAAEPEAPADEEPAGDAGTGPDIG